MKVSQEKEFKPIMLVLETEEEAYALWHRLNVSISVLKSTIKTRLYMKTAIEAVEMPMFNAFNDVYRPKE